MSEFQVTVYTRVKELYYVEAESAEAAKENWHAGEFGNAVEEAFAVIAEIARTIREESGDGDE